MKTYANPESIIPLQLYHKNTKNLNLIPIHVIKSNEDNTNDDHIDGNLNEMKFGRNYLTPELVNGILAQKKKFLSRFTERPPIIDGTDTGTFTGTGTITLTGDGGDINTNTVTGTGTITLTAEGGDTQLGNRGNKTIIKNYLFENNTNCKTQNVTNIFK